jgi:hypothetical protein
MSCVNERQDRARKSWSPPAPPWCKVDPRWPPRPVLLDDAAKRRSVMDLRVFLGTVVGSILLAAPLAAEAQEAGRTVTIGYPGNSSPSLESNLVDAFREGLRQRGYVAGPKLILQDKRTARQERSGILAGDLRDLNPAVILTAGSSGTLKRPMRRQRWTENDWSSLAAWTILLAVMVVPFLVCVGILVLVSSRRRGRKLRRILVALVVGSACGALWILLVDTVVNAPMPGATNEPTILVVGVVTAALIAASLLLRPDRLRQMVGLSAMVIGFHSLALPIAALISFAVRGAQWFPAASVRPALTAVILGTRLAGDLSTVGLSVGGLLLGLCLVFVGERVLTRSKTSSPRARFDLSRPHA